ncbi:MAG: hypothetical protein KAT53_02905, partial [Dehalococcoidia bacterium]|nr:hypothetical protein [Dehalococcoidia bacterium]
MGQKRRLLFGISLAVMLGASVSFAGAACLPGEGFPDSKTPEPAASLPQPSQQRPNNVEHYVEPADPLVRDTAVSAVQA